MAGDTVEQIKEKLDIAEVIKPYLTLQPAGKNYKALCPFHKEKTPSLIVTPDRQIWHCFGCGAGGDMFTFLMRYENMEFFEALKMLAEKAGIDITRTGSVDQKRFTLLYDLNRAAKEAFQSAFGKNEEVRRYLNERGLTQETIEAFEIGFAPAMPDALMRFLIKKGFSANDIERAGLVMKNDRGMYIDRFRNRIMFPLANHFGKTIGFTGRIMPSDQANAPKYMNSPETLVFNKSKVIFAFDKTKNDIRETKTAVLVEGQMDAIMLWQAGVRNVVATSGTALTGDHLQVLRRIAETLVVAFDSDEAGHVAAERAIDLAAAHDFVVRVFEYGETGAKDPAEIAQKDAALVKEKITAAAPAMEYYMRKYRVAGAVHTEDIIELKRGVRAVLTKIAALESAVERDHWVRQLATASGIAATSIREELQKVNAPRTAAPKGEPTPRAQREAVSRKDRIANQLVTMAALNAAFAEKLAQHLNLLPDFHKEVLTTGFQNLSAIAVAGHDRAMLEGEGSEAHFTTLLRELTHEDLKGRRQEVLERHRVAELRGDDAMANEALQEVDEINGKLHNLNN